jgi:integrase
VSCYRHHGAWWIRWSDPDDAARTSDGRACLHRSRVGRSRLEAEFQASLQNAELLRRELGWQTPSPAPLPAPAPPLDPLPEAAAELLASIARLARAHLPAANVSNAASAERPAAPPAPPAKTVAELRKWFLGWHENVRGTSAGSITRYQAATLHVERYAERHEIFSAGDVTPDGFAKYLRGLVISPNGHANSAKRPLSEKGIRIVLETTRAMYRLASREGFFPDDAKNPFEKLTIPRTKTADAKAIFVFDAETEARFLAACDDWAFAIFFALFTTGLRVGELTHLLIEDLDLDNGWIRVCSKPDAGWLVKTRVDRDVPIGDELRDVLRWTIRARDKGPVFLQATAGTRRPPRLRGGLKELAAEARRRLEERRREKGDVPDRRAQAAVYHSVWNIAGAVPADRVRTAFMRVAKQIGIDATCPKSTRHSFATLLQEANVDPLIRQLTLGHSPTTPEQGGLGMSARYTHTSPGIQRREILRALTLRERSLALARSRVVRSYV